uniref:VWFC domain-containing protein n=1 Tax=Anopheles epiroticus TaxID=199890 RepID=A0A182NZJ7_9DIPT
MYYLETQTPTNMSPLRRSCPAESTHVLLQTGNLPKRALLGSTEILQLVPSSPAAARVLQRIVSHIIALVSINPATVITAQWENGTPNGESNLPVASELNTMCQPRREVDPTKDINQRGQPFFPLPNNSNYAETYRHVQETVPITQIGGHRHRSTRYHRDRAVLYSMGVYENEPPTKATHCYSLYGRMRPYFIPHRTRTKSESSDPSNPSLGQESAAHASSSANNPAISTGLSTTLMETCEPTTAMMDVSTNVPGGSTSSAVRYKNPIVVLKKSRSLENVRVDNSLDASQASHEMEFVSSRIQKLKVQDVLARCPVPTKHYTTLGCEPSDELNVQGCPLWFNCTALEQRSRDKCYLYGKTYELHEHVPDEKVKSSCLALCTCQMNSRRGVAEFHCAHIDCPEFLSPHRAGCVRQYRTNDCCSSRQACGEKRANLPRCTVGSVTYYEGERMQLPADPCLTCICTQHFNESDPFRQTKCYTNECAFELIAPSVLSNGAAPVYYGNRCCPWEWRLPKPEDRINEETEREVGSDTTEELTAKNSCTYGNLTLGVGESLAADSTPVGVYRCYCAIPPIVHCTLTPL